MGEFGKLTLYVHITHVWLPRRPCKLGLALASVDPLLECVSVCLCVGTYTYMYVSCIWGMLIHVYMYVPVHIRNVRDTCLFVELLSVR